MMKYDANPLATSSTGPSPVVWHTPLHDAPVSLINTGCFPSTFSIKELKGDPTDIESAARLLLLHGSRSNSDKLAGVTHCPMYTAMPDLNNHESLGRIISAKTSVKRGHGSVACWSMQPVHTNRVDPQQGLFGATAQLSEGSPPAWDIHFSCVKQEPHLHASQPPALQSVPVSQNTGIETAELTRKNYSSPAAGDEPDNPMPGAAGATKGDLTPCISPAAGGPVVKVAGFTQAGGASRDHSWPLGATRGLSFESALEILLGPATNYLGRPACLGPAECGLFLEDKRFGSAQVRGPAGCCAA